MSSEDIIGFVIAAVVFSFMGTWLLLYTGVLDKIGTKLRIEDFGSSCIEMPLRSYKLDLVTRKFTPIPKNPGQYDLPRAFSLDSYYIRIEKTILGTRITLSRKAMS